jgi:hypothetical protein
MELVKSWVEPRGDPFKFFPCFFSKNEYTYRYIFNDDQYNSVIKLANDLFIRGEDPRSFFMNGKRYIAHNIFTGNFANMQHYITEYDTGKHYQYIVDYPNFFYGKNWTPFVTPEQNLYIIHAFDPFTVLSNGKVLFSVNLGLEKRQRDQFCKWRGNSNGLVHKSIIYGFGHISENDEMERYKPFMWIIDPSSCTLKMAEVDYQNDEYKFTHFNSLWIEDDEAYICVWDEKEHQGVIDNRTRTSIFKLNFDKIAENLVWKTFNIPELLKIK